MKSAKTAEVLATAITSIVISSMVIVIQVVILRNGRNPRVPRLFRVALFGRVVLTMIVALPFIFILAFNNSAGLAMFVLAAIVSAAGGILFFGLVTFIYYF